MSCIDIKRIRLGTLPDFTYPPDDTKTYIYSRLNGHVYVYKNGNERHICCDDDLISKVPILLGTVADVSIPDTSVLDTPDTKHIFLFYFNNQIYEFNNDRTYNPIGGGSSTLDWNLKEW